VAGGCVHAAGGRRWGADPLEAAPPGRWAERSGARRAGMVAPAKVSGSKCDPRAARRRRALDPVEPNSTAFLFT
jgi:hypothetical protein